MFFQCVININFINTLNPPIIIKLTTKKIKGTVLGISKYKNCDIMTNEIVKKTEHLKIVLIICPEMNLITGIYRPKNIFENILKDEIIRHTNQNFTSKTK